LGIGHISSFTILLFPLAVKTSSVVYSDVTWIRITLETDGRKLSVCSTAEAVFMTLLQYTTDILTS